MYLKDKIKWFISVFIFKKVLRSLALLTLLMFVMSSLLGATTIAPDNQALTFNNTMFGMKGPFSLQATYSKLFGLTFEGTYTQLLNQRNAVAAELDLGGKQRRFGATWAHALTTNQLIKITAENLSQDLDFDFFSGKTSKWIYQNAIGASYAYLIKDNMLHDININAYYSKANSKTLPYKDYTVGATNYRNFRRIAGGTDKSISVGADVTPTPATLVGIQANYDNVSYKMKNDLTAKNNSKGLGATVSLEQIINDNVKFNLLASHRKPYQDYQAGINWLASSKPGSSLELGLLGERIVGNLGTKNDNQVGINMTYSWGGSSTAKPMVYAVTNLNDLENLRNWVGKPAVHMEQVLALKDESKIALQDGKTNPVNTVANNEITVHPREAKQIDVTQYFASQTNDKDANKIEYAIKTMPKNHNLQYKDGKLIINKDSFTTKDRNQKFTIQFVPANINTISSLSIVSLVLTVKSYDSNPYPNKRYMPGGEEPIQINLQVGKKIDPPLDPVKEGQQEDKKYQLMINPDFLVKGNDLKAYFKQDEEAKLTELGLSYKVDYIPRTKGKGYPNTYFVLTFSGTPTQQSRGSYKFHLYAEDHEGGESRTPLLIPITISGTDPHVDVLGKTTYNVGDTVDEEDFAEAHAGASQTVKDLTITPEEGAKHPLSDYGINEIDIDKTDPTKWVIALKTKDSKVKLPDDDQTNQKYLVTMHDTGPGNKPATAEFTLTVNGIVIEKSPTYDSGTHVQDDEFAKALAGNEYTWTDITITPEGGAQHPLSDYGLKADIDKVNPAKWLIKLDGTTQVPADHQTSQKYQITGNYNGNTPVTGEFTLTVNPTTTKYYCRCPNVSEIVDGIGPDGCSTVIIHDWKGNNGDGHPYRFTSDFAMPPVTKQYILDNYYLKYAKYTDQGVHKNHPVMQAVYWDSNTKKPRPITMETPDKGYTPFEHTRNIAFTTLPPNVKCDSKSITQQWCEFHYDWHE